MRCGAAMAEAHFGWVEDGDRVLPDLLQLRKLRPDCPVHTMSIREPLEYYLSFYRWGVAFRRSRARRPSAPPSSSGSRRCPTGSRRCSARMAAMAAEYHVSQFKRSYHTPLWGRLDDEGRQKLSSFLDTFSTVAPMAHFDASILMASDATGLPLLLYKRNKPGQKGGFRGTSATVCPDMLACRAAVAKAAPLDTWMYEKYAKAFEGKLAELGDDFAGRVDAYKQAVAAAQPAWKRVPRKQFLCRYHPEDDVIARMPAPSCAAPSATRPSSAASRTRTATSSARGSTSQTRASPTRSAAGGRRADSRDEFISAALSRLSGKFYARDERSIGT